MPAIEVRMRSHDYHAQIAGDPKRWGAGKNSYEAIGSLIVNHAELFDIRVDWLPDEYKRSPKN